MPKPKKNKTLIRILVIGASAAFAGSTLFFTLAGLFSGNNNPRTPQEAATEQTDAINKELAARASGYEIVLKREPDNQVALQGLAQTRIEMDDWQGAVEPIEKLVELNPQEPVFLERLAAVRIQSQDFEGAIAVLEQLAALNPEKYQGLLEGIQQQLSKNQVSPGAPVEGEGEDKADKEDKGEEGN